MKILAKVEALKPWDQNDRTTSQHHGFLRTISGNGDSLVKFTADTEKSTGLPTFGLTALTSRDEELPPTVHLAHDPRTGCLQFKQNADFLVAKRRAFLRSNVVGGLWMAGPLSFVLSEIPEIHILRPPSMQASEFDLWRGFMANKREGGQQQHQLGGQCRSVTTHHHTWSHHHTWC